MPLPKSFGIARGWPMGSGQDTSVTALQRILPPSEFTYIPPYNVFRRTNGQIVHDYTSDSRIPTIDGPTYYWKPVTGNDANDGLTPSTAKRSLSVMLQMTPPGNTFQIIGLEGGTFRSSLGWLNVQATKSVVVRWARTAGQRLNLVAGGASLPTWSVNPTYANVYSATTSAPVSIVDVKIFAQPTIIIESGRYQTVDGVYRLGDGVTPITINNAPPIYDVANQVSSLAAVAAAIGSAWFHDGTQLHAKAADGRSLIGDTDFHPTISGSNGRMGAQNGQVLFVEGINFLGGTPFSTSQPSTVTGQNLYFDFCSFQGGGSGNGGLQVSSRVDVTSYRCGFYFSYRDGGNYHSQEADGVTPGTSPTFNEIECVFKGNGTTGSAGSSDNDSTAHDYCEGVRVNCLLLGSDDRVLVDVNFAKSWNLGSQINQARQIGAGKESVSSLDAAMIWIDTCNIPPGPNVQVQVGTGSAVRYKSMPAPGYTGGGTFEPY